MQKISSILSIIDTQLALLSLRDQQIIRSKLRQLKNITDKVKKPLLLKEIERYVTDAIQYIENRRLTVPLISYPQNLPVTDKKAEIYQTIKKHQVVIIAGETGSGKTTQIPKICLELGRGIKGIIGHTQPRRLAARSVAIRLAEELQTSIGKVVGYKVRFSDQVSATTLIKLMTDGILLAEIQQDKLLLKYDTIIIDEAHERSLNIDFILGYLKQILPKRPDLKVIITSATIDVERFSHHFNHAPIIEVSGRTYPVEVRYRPIIESSEQGDQLQAIIGAIDELTAESRDDILVFMSGEKEIRDTAKELDKLNLLHTEILPLYARLSISEQNRIFQSHSGRRIILATNVAETSLTVPGIKYVIDPGIARISRYSFRTKVQRLPIEPISQAAANQRKGRCGRTSAGICIRLYAETDFLSRPLFTAPEIVRTNLASVILQMMALRLGSIEQFPFIDAPDKRNIQDGIRLLNELGAIQLTHQQPSYQLTELGKQLALLPLDPRLARMILEAQKQGAVREMMIITAALSIQDPRERPFEKQQAADEKHRRFVDKTSDFMSILNLWYYITEQQHALSVNQFRKLCRQEYLNYLRIKEWQDIYTQLRQIVKELAIAINSKIADSQQIHQALLSGLLSHIGMKDTEGHEFTGTRNSRFGLYPNSALFKKPPKWCMVAELVETTRLWGRIAADINPEWIEPLALHLVNRNYSDVHWSKAQGVAIAKEKVILFGLPIILDRAVNYSKIEPLISRQLFIRHALVEGDWQAKHAFFRHNQVLLEEVEDLEHKSRRRDIVVDEQQLFDFYDNRIPATVISVRHFDRWWKEQAKQTPDLLNYDKAMLTNPASKAVSEADFPDSWRQGNLLLPLTYQFEPGNDEDGVTVQIPLSVLNQVSEEGFDWQIPGLRMELIIALIKSLPKPIRRSLVPAPNYAEAFLARGNSLQGSLLTALETTFRKMTGVIIEREDWRLDQVPTHLFMTFRILDEKGQKLAEGKQLAQLKTQLKVTMQQALSTVADNDHIEQEQLEDWTFGDLPKTYERKQLRFSVKAYPALIDEQHRVSIKLLDSEEQQKQAMLSGIRRLLLLTIPSPVKYLHEKLPNRTKLSLYFASFGTVIELIDDCIYCAIDKLIQDQGGIIWQQQQFEQLRQYVRQHLNEIVFDIAQKIEGILTVAYQLTKRLKANIDITYAVALSDIKTQLNSLVYKGFITDSGYQQLANIQRYLQAIERRLEKLASDVNKDRLQMLKITQVNNAYQKLFAILPVNRRKSEEVLAVRWMIEELRVSLFAQQLGTAYPVSDKRILQYIDNIKY